VGYQGSIIREQQLAKEHFNNLGFGAEPGNIEELAIWPHSNVYIIRAIGKGLV